MINLTQIAKNQIPELGNVESINWRLVDSSFIAQVAWVHTGGRLGIVLIAIQNGDRGGLYAYYDVPSWVYAAWFMGGSFGSYYCKVFKGQPRFAGRAHQLQKLAAWGSPTVHHPRPRLTARERRLLEDGRKFGLHNRRHAA